MGRTGGSAVVTGSGQQPMAPADAVLRARRDALGEAFPRAAVLVFDESDPSALRKTVERIPETVDACLDEVVIVPPDGHAAPDLRGLAPGRALDVRLHRLPRQAGHGGARKAAFEYALLRGFDLVVTLHGDGRHPPERIPSLLLAALETPEGVVLAARRVRRGQREVHAAHRVAHTGATALQNRLLGLWMEDYHSSFRVYAACVLRRIPFHLCDEDRAFDMQVVIQCRALGAPLREVSMPPTWREYPSSLRGLLTVLRYTAAALDYRLHQLHVTRRGRYLLHRRDPYTLKSSPTGSHMQILEAVRPGSRVLDLGCSQGLLAAPLRERGCRITGVDLRPPGALAERFDGYYARDLEQPLEIPTGRVFDYVICSDVIEHLRNRTELLRSVRRYLKPAGRLLISTPNVALWFYRLSLLLGRFEYGPRGVLDETHVHLYTRSTFRRTVRNAGFHVVRERVTALPFEVVFESTGRSRLVQAAASGYHVLARLWPSLFAYQVILEAEITTLDDESTRPL